MGASAYLTSPLWLILVLFGVLQPLGLFGDNPALHPSGWPLTLTIVLLFGPKVLSVLWLLIDDSRRKALGGLDGILNSIAIEIPRSEEHTSELQSLMRISYAVFCLKKKKTNDPTQHMTTY